METRDNSFSPYMINTYATGNECSLTYLFAHLLIPFGLDGIRSFRSSLDFKFVVCILHHAKFISQTKNYLWVSAGRLGVV
jgi:hypothetical protein